VANSWPLVPRAAAHTIVVAGSTGSYHANELIYTDGQVSSASCPSCGSVHGRCWSGQDQTNTYSAACAARGSCPTIATAPYVPGQCAASSLGSGVPSANCQCFNDGWTVLDPGNTVGTSGLCFVGNSAITELRLMTVRTTPAGSIFSWPQSVSTNDADKTWTPSLDATYYFSDFPNNTALTSYRQFPISFTTGTSAPLNAGVVSGTDPSSPASVTLPANVERAANLRNCAAKASTTVGVVFENPSFVFWSERSPLTSAFAVQRSMFGTAGFFLAPQPMWGVGRFVAGSGWSGGVSGNPTGLEPSDPFGTSGSPATGALLTAVDSGVVGIVFDPSPASGGYLYAVSFTSLYATTNPDAPMTVAEGATATSTPVTWYLLVRIGEGAAFSFGTAGKAWTASMSTNYFQGSEHRGVAVTPRSCVYAGASFRALGQSAEADVDEETA
jgi:hypothetical protein